EDGEDGLPDDQEIQGPAGVFDVFDVVADPLLEVGAGLAGALDLPEAGDAGADAQAGLAPGGAELVFGEGAGAGADDGHVADEDVEELRELVDAELADELADAGEAGVVLDIELGAVDLVILLDGLLHRFGILAHGAELEAGE